MCSVPLVAHPLVFSQVVMARQMASAEGASADLHRLCNGLSTTAGLGYTVGWPSRRNTVCEA